MGQTAEAIVLPGPGLSRTDSLGDAPGTSCALGAGASCAARRGGHVNIQESRSVAVMSRRRFAIRRRVRGVLADRSPPDVPLGGRSLINRPSKPTMRRMSKQVTPMTRTTLGPESSRRARASLVALLVAAISLLAWAPTASAETTFVVTSAIDAVDARLGDGSCRTSSGVCTLRAAIQEANALAGRDRIEIPAGTYEITVARRGSNGADSGDFDITGPVTVVGAGAGKTTVGAGQRPGGSPSNRRGLDRVLEVNSSTRRRDDRRVDDPRGLQLRERRRHPTRFAGRSAPGEGERGGQLRREVWRWHQQCRPRARRTGRRDPLRQRRGRGW